MIARMKAIIAHAAGWSAEVGQWLKEFRQWPWMQTLSTLRERFREDRLGITASSLSFTTLISLVPLVTVMLAVFTAFPMFAGLEAAVQKYFIQNLVPDSIGKPVLQALSEFAVKARGMGTAGLLLLLATALAVVLTIDRTLNRIWRVRQVRPLGQRVLVYWALLTLGPLALGLSLSATGLLLSASPGLAQASPGGVAWLLDAAQFALLATAAAALYRYVPNTHVRWSHAFGGGFFVAVAFELTKKGLALYLEWVPTFSTMYGAFAILPILMLWVYLVWAIVLLGAVVAAYMPSLQMRVASHGVQAGWRFELALVLLQRLRDSRQTHQHGLSMAALATALRIDPLQLEPVLELLCDLDWVSRLSEALPQAQSDPRYVLLCDPAKTALAPLIESTLLAPGPATVAFRSAGGLGELMLSQALQQRQSSAA